MKKKVICLHVTVLQLANIPPVLMLAESNLTTTWFSFGNAYAICTRNWQILNIKGQIANILDIVSQKVLVTKATVN